MSESQTLVFSRDHDANTEEERIEHIEFLARLPLGCLVHQIVKTFAHMRLPATGRVCVLDNGVSRGRLCIGTFKRNWERKVYGLSRSSQISCPGARAV